MKSGRFLRTLIGLLLVGSGTVAVAGPERVDVYKAISIADSAVKTQVQNSAELEIVTVKRFSRPLNDLIRTKPSDPYLSDLYEKLKKHTYWLVYYVTPGAEFGGDVGVFVDARAGTIVGIYQGK